MLSQGRARENEALIHALFMLANKCWCSPCQLITKIVPKIKQHAQKCQTLNISHFLPWHLFSLCVCVLFLLCFFFLEGGDPVMTDSPHSLPVKSAVQTACHLSQSRLTCALTNCHVPHTLCRKKKRKSAGKLD